MPMKLRLVHLFFFGLIANCSSPLFAQIENSAYSATGRGGVGTTMLLDYQALGVNPANIGIKKYEGKRFTLGFMEVSANTLLQGVKQSDINYFVKGDLFKSDSLNYSGKLKGAQLLSGKAFGANVDVMPLGLAYNHDKIGGFAFSVRESIRYFMDFNQNFTNYAFNGALSNLFPQLITNNNDTVANDPNQYQNYYMNNGGIKAGYNANGISVGRVLNNTSYKMSWTRDWSLGYGKKIIDIDERHALYAGITVKYIQGFGYIDINAKDNKLTGVAAYMPALNQLDSLLKIPARDAGQSYKSIGNGMGFDFGLTAKLFDNFRVGMSLINIGSINYKSNVYNVRDTTYYSVAYSSDFLGGFDNVIKWDKRENIKVALPSQFRFGASASLANKRIEVGVDMVKPLNKQPGNYNTTAYAIGGDFYVLRWLKLSTGTSWGGNFASTSEGYKTRVAIPFGIGIVTGQEGGFEFGIATRDVTTYFLNQISPMYSMAIGLVRIRL